MTEGSRLTTQSPSEVALADAGAVCDGLARDAVYEALAPVENELAACLASLRNDDDTGTRYHLRRIVLAVKSAALEYNTMFAEADTEKADAA